MKRLPADLHLLTTTTFLDLSYNDLQASLVPAGAITLPNLVEFRTSANPNLGVAAINHAIENCPLLEKIAAVSWATGGDGSGDADALAMATAIKNAYDAGVASGTPTRLWYPMVFFNNKISNQGAIDICAKFQGNTVVRDLALTRNALEGSAVAACIALLETTRITNLHFTSNSLTDAGMTNNVVPALTQYFNSRLSGSIAASDFDASNDQVTVSTAFYNTLLTGDEVIYDKGTAGNNVVGGLVDDTSYYVRKSSTSQKIYLYATKAEATAASSVTAGRKDLSAGGSGTDHTLTLQQVLQELNLSQLPLTNAGSVAFYNVMINDISIMNIGYTEGKLGTGSGAELSITLSNNLVSVAIVASKAGSGYTAGSLKFVGGTCSQEPVGTYTVDGSGALTGISMSTAGNCSVAPTLAMPGSWSQTGASKLADYLAGPNCKLSKIWIADANIGDDGMIAIANALKVNATLEELFLNSNQITVAGATALKDALTGTDTATTGNSKLKYIEMKGMFGTLGAAGNAKLAELRAAKSSDFTLFFDTA
jgi:hypothetical protein